MTVHRLRAGREALFSTPTDTHTNLWAALFRAPAQPSQPIAGQFILTIHRSVYSDQWQNRWTNRGLHKRRRILADDSFLNFPSYIVHTISSYHRGRTFEASFQTATSSRRGMRAGVAQGGLISPVLFSLYVNVMPSPSHHVELALYADDTAVIATSR